MEPRITGWRPSGRPAATVPEATLSTASQATPPPVVHRPLHWAPVAAAVAVVLALLLAIAMVPPAADRAPRPAASVGAPSPQPAGSAPSLSPGVTP